MSSAMQSVRPGFLLWDMANTNLPSDVNITKFAYEALETVNSIKSIKLTNIRAYHNGALTPRLMTEISKVGYELIVQEPGSRFADYHLDALFWLLDNRIFMGSPQSASIVIITSNSVGLQSLIQRLRQRR